MGWYARYCRLRPQDAATLFVSAAGEALSAKTPAGRLNTWMRRIGVGSTGFASHSCRRGGITAAAAAGIERRLLMRHGNWHSAAVDLYITDTLNARLSISAAMLAGLS